MLTPLDSSVLVALITGSVTLLGTAMTVRAGNRKTQEMLKLNQAIQEERITELTREVRKHNGFAERIPRVEAKIEVLEEKVEKLEEKAWRSIGRSELKTRAFG